MSRLLYQLGVTPQHILKIHLHNMVHDSDSQFVGNLDYQLVNKKLAFLIIKTLFIRCIFIKCDLCFNNVQNIILNYIIAFTNNLISENNFKRSN